MQSRVKLLICSLASALPDFSELQLLLLSTLGQMATQLVHLLHVIFPYLMHNLYIKLVNIV